MIKYSLLVFAIVTSLMIQPLAFGATSSSPKGQYATGTDLHEIECKEGYELIFKAKKWSPACVKESSVERLISLGWAANHDAQHQKMMESEKMAAEKPVEEKPVEEEKKSHKIELKESMEMAGQ